MRDNYSSIPNQDQFTIEISKIDLDRQSQKDSGLNKYQILSINPSESEIAKDFQKETQGRDVDSLQGSEITNAVKPLDVVNKADLVTITFKSLTYSVSVKNAGTDNMKKSNPKYVERELIRGLTGICKPRELTAIMGASGAGKTTLLNALSLRVTTSGKNRLSGELLANGQTYDANKFSKFAGYVMQNDILFSTMTPREIFQFAAHLRLALSSAQRKQRVNELIQDLRLEKAADTLVGGQLSKGISGGERKRTSIGVELITDPHLLFLDEPTSGLDSFTAFILINLLRSLAIKQGKAIIFTIHQPSTDIFCLFDKLMIMAKGKFLYQGPARDAVEYFEAIGFPCPEYCNPADHFISLAHSSGNDEEKFEKMFQAYDAKLALGIEKDVESVCKSQLKLAEKKNGFFASFKIIAKRSLKNFMRNPILLRGRIVQTIFVSFLICCIYFRVQDSDNDSSDTSASNENTNNLIRDRMIFDINGALFFLSVSLFMMSCMSVLLTFPTERAVFLKEYSSNMYSVPAYFFGRSSTEIPFVILFPVLMTAVCYYIIGFNDHNAGKFFLFMLVLIFVSLSGNAVGLMAGCMFNDPKVASNVVPTLLLPMMVFAGFYINADSIPVWLAWIQYLSPFRYSFEAFLWNEYSDSVFGTGQLEIYHYALGFWGAFGLLVGLGLFFRLLALISLGLLVRRLQ